MTIANSLIENALEGAGMGYHWIDVGGVPVTLPYHEIEMQGFCMYGSSYPGPDFDRMVKAYTAGQELITDPQFPRSWHAMLAKASRERLKLGLTGPVDFASALFFFVCEYPDAVLLAEAGVRPFSLAPKSHLDFCMNKQLMHDIWAEIDADSLMRDWFRRQLSIQCPDSNGGYLDETHAEAIINAAGVQEELLVDLGTGMGAGVVRWAEGGFPVVAIDRQYHPRWYDEFWKTDGIMFLHADIRNLPFGNDQAGVVTMEYVAGHMTKAGLESALKEVLRILRTGGILLVGPQMRGEDSRYRIFRKEAGILYERKLREL